MKMYMNVTAAVKTDGKWNLFKCVANENEELSKAAKKRFKKVTAIVVLETEELPIIDVL